MGNNEQTAVYWPKHTHTHTHTRTHARTYTHTHTPRMLKFYPIKAESEITEWNPTVASMSQTPVGKVNASSRYFLENNLLNLVKLVSQTTIF